MIKILTYKVSEGNIPQFGGGVNQSLIEKAREGIEKTIDTLEDDLYQITDLKVNHFTTRRHNNGGCDEVWVQYTICYKPTKARNLREAHIDIEKRRRTQYEQES